MENMNSVDENKYEIKRHKHVILLTVYTWVIYVDDIYGIVWRRITYIVG